MALAVYPLIFAATTSDQEKIKIMLRRKIAAAALLFALMPTTGAFAQAVYTAPAADIDKIKDEGMNHSQVMQTLSYLTDVIGQRLTASPSLYRANEWTRDTMKKWGMQNAHLEAWGPFGRGWVLKGFSAQISAPYDIPLIGYPKAWAPGTKGELNADVVYLDAKDDAALEKYKGQLKGKVVLLSDIRPLKPDYKGIGRTFTDEQLATIATPPAAPAGQPAQPSADLAARR